ncbi:unnamed protein product [Timema podura]|uniref:Uncharacterized protein n=1 Tax=Timema podura TaxID=61482 RepID=A0ABN7PR62_TIMPD|nr:unnamed protein product [Timema podura]
MDIQGSEGKGRPARCWIPCPGFESWRRDSSVGIQLQLFLPDLLGCSQSRAYSG